MSSKGQTCRRSLPSPWYAPLNDCVCVCTGPQLQSGSPIASPLTGSHVSRVGLWECEMSLSPWAKDTQPNGRSQSSPKSAVWEWHIVLELSLMAAVHINMTRKHTGKMHECDNKMEPRVLTYQGSINRQPRKKKKSCSPFRMRISTQLYVFKVLLHLKNENCHSHLCRTKLVWLSFLFCRCLVE